MELNKIKFLINSNGTYLDTILPPITANEDGRTIVQVIAPFPITDIVSVNYSIRPIQATVKGSYLVPTGKFGKDVLDEDYTHFQTVADWNVFEIPINAVALEYISKYRAGLVLVSFTIKQLQTPYFATNYLGLFSNTQPIPETSYNDGDYFIANEYNFTAHDITWAKGDYAYFYNGKWNKGKSVLKASTPSIELPVDPSLKDAPQLEYDEDVALLLANDLGLLTQRVSQSETDIESAENDINEIDGRVGVNETDIYNLESDVGNLQSDKADKTDLAVTNQNIVNLQTVIDNKDADTLQEAKEYADEKDAYKLDKIWTDLTNQTTSFLTDKFVLNRGNSVYKTTLATMLSNVVVTEIFVVVQELPENGQINKIYLVPNQESEVQNIYDEFIWVFDEDAEEYDWEKIGSVGVDLSNYFNKTEINSMLDNKVDKVTGKALSTNDYTNTDKQSVEKIPTIEQDILDLESDKVDKVSGKGLSTNDYTTTEKNKLAGIASGAKVNVQSDWDATSGDALILNKPTFATVATSGAYADLTGKPDLNLKLDKNFSALPAQANPLFTDVLVLNRGTTVQKVTLANLLAQVDNEIFEVVSVLPTTGVANKIYLVPSSDPKTQNTLDEFIWLNNDWERIGGISVDLSNYFNKTEINSLLGDKVDKNADIEPNTHPKITYDAKGLVTGGGALVANDIPNLNATKINAGTFDASRIPSLAPTKITQNASNRFVTDVEKAYWDEKVDKVTGMGLSDENFTLLEKNKLANLTQVVPDEETIVFNDNDELEATNVSIWRYK